MVEQNLSNATAEFSDEEIAELSERLNLRVLPEGGELLPNSYEDEEARCDVRKVLLAAGRLALENSSELAHPESPLNTALSWLQGQVDVANNLRRTQFGADHHVDDSARGRFQGKNFTRINDHAQTLPAAYLRAVEAGNLQRPTDDLLVVAPTGTGKTYMQAQLLRHAGVGTVPQSGMSRSMRAVLVVSDQALLRQYYSQEGENTFRHWLGREVDVSSFWQYDKNVQGDVVLLSRQSVEKALDKGGLNPRDVDLVVVDEGHHGLEPKMITRLNEFTRVYYFTATPAYNLRRDLRRNFRHIEISTLTDCIYEGILNSAELYTFKADTTAEGLALAAQLADNDLKEGRQAIVFCPRGDKAASAAQVAELINRLHAQRTGDHDQVASRVSDYEADASAIISRFTDGSLRALTAVNMLSEGYDGPVDTLILAGLSSSLLQTAQRIGRALRPGAFRTRLIEIVLPNNDGKERISIWDAMGFDEVRQGFVIARREYERGTSLIKPSSEEDSEWVARLPQNLKTSLVENQPVRTMKLPAEELEGERMAAEGYAAAQALAGRHGVTLRVMQEYLDRHGFAFVGVWTPIEGTRLYERWYEPKAVAFLEERPIPRPSESGEMTASDLVQLFGMSLEAVYAMADKAGLTFVERRWGKMNRTARYYPPEEVEKFKKYFDSIPMAAETDRTLGAVTNELGEKFVLRWIKDRLLEPQYKRRNPVHGIKGFDLHITQEQSEALHEAFEQALATEDEISYVEMGALTGISPVLVIRALTPDEKAQAQLKRAHPKARPGYHLPRKVGLGVVERLAIRPLPAHLVPLTMAYERIDVKKGTIYAQLKRIEQRSPELFQLVRFSQAGVTTCFPWSVLEELESRYALKKGVERIDYRRIATDKNTTSMQWRYSTDLQSRYVPGDSLVLSENPEHVWHEAGGVAVQYNCSPAALAVTARLVGVTEDQVQRPSPTTILLHVELLPRIESFLELVPTMPQAWISLGALAHSTHLNPNQLQALAADMGITVRQRKLGRLPHEPIDICFAPDAAKRIVDAAQRLRRDHSAKKA